MRITISIFEREHRLTVTQNYVKAGDCGQYLVAISHRLDLVYAGASTGAPLNGMITEQTARTLLTNFLDNKGVSPFVFENGKFVSTTQLTKSEKKGIDKQLVKAAKKLWATHPNNLKYKKKSAKSKRSKS